MTCNRNVNRWTHYIESRCMAA